jgi:hypothetical protein
MLEVVLFASLILVNCKVLRQVLGRKSEYNSIMYLRYGMYKVNIRSHHTVAIKVFATYEGLVVKSYTTINLNASLFVTEAFLTERL